MAARRPRHRRWWVRRRHFLDAQGDQVTDTWLNIPLLPRRILIVSWRRGYMSTWHIQYSPSPSPVGFVLPAVLLLATLVWSSFLDIGTSQWVARIPIDLMLLVGLVLSVLRWRATHRRA